MPDPDTRFRSRHALAEAVEIGSGPGRPRLSLSRWPRRVYAIGDTHGCFDLLLALMDRIAADARGDEEDTLVILLGDYIDRGPQSAELLDWAIDPATATLPRICLGGNHEELMTDFLAEPEIDSPWLANGGLATLESYGIDLETFIRFRIDRAVLDAAVPAAHRSFVATLPSILTLPGTAFIHAGVRPGVALEAQSERDLLWIRQEFYRAADQLDFRVIHGHTPSDQPFVSPTRICVDTGAYASGVLTSVCLTQHREPYFLNTGADFGTIGS